MPGSRFIPYKGLDLDSSQNWIKPQFARFIKNLVYVLNDSSQVGANQQGNTGVFKPYESNGKFDISFVLPDGKNKCTGFLVSRDTEQVLFLNHNSNNNHGVYIIDAISQTIQKCYVKNCLGLVLDPKYFLHEGGGTLEIFDFTDPNTELPRRRSYFMYTDGFNYQKFICLEDSIATNGFDRTLFSYFNSDWDECDWINCGVPTPRCPSFSEVPNDNPTLPNYLKFNTWQFRIQYVDVYGRPSEWSMPSDLYIPGENDCISTSELLSRCLDLTFDAGSPFIDKINIAFRNCNEPQWYLDTTLFLYKGSCLGDWWTRTRNADIQYNPTTNFITYRFCRNKGSEPVPQDETNRAQNPMPRTCQSLAKIGKVIGMGNNKDGFNPLNIEDVSVTVTPPQPGTSDTANIEIYVPIINPFTQQYQPIYQTEGSVWVWGGRYTNVNQYVSNVDTGYGQKFGTSDQKGFIGYLAGTGGTPNSTVSELYYVDDSNNFVKVEDYNIVYNPPYTQRRWYNKFTFNSVPRAKYVFRIAGHQAKTTDSNFSATSTFVVGQFAWNNKTTVFNNSRDNFGVVNSVKELEIDVCSGNYNSENDTKVLAIFDLTAPGSVGNDATKALSGYITEGGEENYPIELMAVKGDKNGNQVYVTNRYTDHNGFYFLSDKNNQYNARIFGNCGCNNWKQLVSFGSGSTSGNVTQNFTIQGREECPDYADKLCSRVLIKGRIFTCDGLPVPGIGVVYTRGGTAISGADGEYTIVAHVDNTQPQRTRNDYVYFVPTICPYYSCNDACLDPIQVVIPPCVLCEERIFTLPDQQVRFKTKRGLLSGGRYGFAIEAEDWLGRITYAQTKDGMYQTMPTIIEAQSFSPSTVAITIPPTVTFPLYFKKLNFLVTKELSLEDYITWIIDKVEFIDNTGEVNEIAPTQIKLYYGSLVEYNKQNNFNTTTGWQFEDTAVTPAVNYTNDYVEFYVNGDGSFFPQLIKALIKYDQIGQYFLIDYDTALKDLTQYAQVRLCRPSNNTDANQFYTLCGSVDLIKGKPEVNTIVLNAFDTYYKYRQIPIPVGTAEDPENVPKTLGIPFEHNSPSDFWGYHCINIGRPNVRNPYECEIIRENQIALSGVLSSNGQLNYQNYFDDAQKTDFDSWDLHGIVSMIWQTAIGLIICENNNFTVGYNDNLVRVNEAGQIVIPSAADKFGKPNIKIGSDYGCNLFDKNTIRSWQGLVHFLDTKEGVVIQHNYDSAVPVSLSGQQYGVEAGIDSWLRPKISYVKQWNKTNSNKKYFIGGIDPAAKTYLLTDTAIETEYYVNEEREIVVEKQETIVFDIYNKIWMAFISSVPEMWAYLQSDTLNQQLFAFQNGNPFKYYTDSPIKTYNTFFGIKCNRVLRIVPVNDAFQKKEWQNIAIITKTLWFADKITTDSNQETRVLKALWKKGDYYYSASFPANILTVSDANLPFKNANKLFEGDLMIGSWIDIRLIGDPDLDDVYTELFGVVIDFQADEKILGGG